MATIQQFWLSYQIASKMQLMLLKLRWVWDLLRQGIKNRQDNLLGLPFKQGMSLQVVMTDIGCPPNQIEVQNCINSLQNRANDIHLGAQELKQAWNNANPTNPIP
jgi:hypothetical protein